MKKLIIGIFVASLVANACAQDADSVHKETSALERITLLTYVRVISDAKGNIRMDENIVPNFRLNKWLRLEIGVRMGERPSRVDSYYHYKAELQTKSFWNVVRFFARLSDNIIRYPSPTYRKSNYLFVAESKFPIARSWVALVAGGYVVTRQQNNDVEGSPIIGGTKKNYPTYKVAVRYLLDEKGFIETAYGAYDVFNPYLITSPFMQLSFERDLSERCKLYSYYRYQYDHTIDRPMNSFFSAGVKVALGKK